MKPQTVDLTLKEVEIGGFLINADLKVTIADQGIGMYEFWGQKGVDTHMGVDEILVVKAEFVDAEHPQYTAEQFLDLDKNEDELFDAANDAWAAHGYDEPDYEEDE